jgi:hypothetical protein
MHAGCHHHTPSWHGLHACTCMHERMGAAGVQVKEDVYEKMDKELLEFVEDVLLNRCDNATERLLEYAATLDPKSKPCSVRQKGVAAAASGGGGGGEASCHQAHPARARKGPGHLHCRGARLWPRASSQCAPVATGSEPAAARVNAVLAADAPAQPPYMPRMHACMHARRAGARAAHSRHRLPLCCHCAHDGCQSALHTVAGYTMAAPVHRECVRDWCRT